MLIIIIIIGVVMGNAVEKRALTFDDLVSCKRLSDPQFSPDGNWIAFAVKTMNEAKNNSHTDIYIVSPDGETLRQFTNQENSCSLPQWSPDGRLTFLSSSQIWIQGINDSDPKQLTTHYSGVEKFVWSPDGKYIAFASRVYPDCTDQDCIQKRDEVGS
jgi:Tol biopolymer transport system component